MILGKTVTTECATYLPSKTRNPHDATRSPGGSSAGRRRRWRPAWCRWRSARSPMRRSSGRRRSAASTASSRRTADLAPRCAQAVALARLRGPVRALARRHRAGRRAAHRLRRKRPRHAAAGAHSVRADAGRRAAADAACGLREDAAGARRRSTREAFGELVAALGASCEEYPLPETLAEAWDWHRTIMEAEMAVISTSSTRRARQAERVAAQPVGARPRDHALAYQRALTRCRG